MDQISVIPTMSVNSSMTWAGYCVFVCACLRTGHLEKVKKHIIYMHRGVLSLECMSYLRYLENLSKEAHILAE